MTKTFILGVGAQKAGTTWLYEQIKKDVRFVPGFAKEYHTFDVLHIPACAPRLDKMRDQAKKLLATECNDRQDQPIYKRFEFINDPLMYFEYFERLLSKKTPSITADITPSYSGLPAPVFEKIKREFESRNVRLRVIFLMREPVSRLLSAIIMKNSDTEKKVGREMVSELMFSHLGKDEENVRSDYRATHRNLLKAFQSNEIFFGFYETLFSESEIKRLATFLNMQVKDFDTSRKINASTQSVRLEKLHIEELSAHFKDRYAFVKECFGSEIHDIWQSSLTRLAGA